VDIQPEYFMKFSHSLVSTVATLAFAGAASAAFTNLLPALGESNTFNSYTTGNLGTQGSWVTDTTSYSGTGAATSSSYTIAADPKTGAAFVNSLKITTAAVGSKDKSGTIEASGYRDASQTISTAWSNRTAGQNFIVMNFSLYMPTNYANGSSGTSNDVLMGGSIQDSSNHIIGGIYVKGDGSVFTSTATASVSKSTTTWTNNFTDSGFNVTLGGGVTGTWNTFQISYDTINRISTFKFTSTGGTSTGVKTIVATALNSGIGTIYSIDVGSNQGNSSGNSQTATIGYFDTIGAYAVPSPGAVALIGLAGLVARRRR
jgi:hypothetical protein